MIKTEIWLLCGLQIWFICGFAIGWKSKFSATHPYQNFIEYPLGRIQLEEIIEFTLYIAKTHTCFEDMSSTISLHYSPSCWWVSAFQSHLWNYFFSRKMLGDLLMGGNWQKWKRVFLTCPCHEIYRDEAVGLKSCKNTWKITIFVKMWNLGQYRENLIFCQ